MRYEKEAFQRGIPSAYVEDIGKIAETKPETMQDVEHRMYQRMIPLKYLEDVSKVLGVSTSQKNYLDLILGCFAGLIGIGVISGLLKGKT